MSNFRSRQWLGDSSEVAGQEKGWSEVHLEKCQFGIGTADLVRMAPNKALCLDLFPPDCTFAAQEFPISPCNSCLFLTSKAGMENRAHLSLNFD